MTSWLGFALYGVDSLDVECHDVPGTCSQIACAPLSFGG